MKFIALLSIILLSSIQSILFTEQCTRYYFGCIYSCQQGNFGESCKNDCKVNFDSCLLSANEYAKKLLNKTKSN